MRTDYNVTGTVKIKGTHMHSFRSGEWATIIGVNRCEIKGLPDRSAYKCLYDDGMVDYIAISDDLNYELSV